MICGMRRSSRLAVAGGMISVAVTSTIPIACSATTTASAIQQHSSANSKNIVRTPAADAIAGS